MQQISFHPKTVLREYKNIDGRGMEIDQKKVQLCLAKGISVIEGDADTDLYDYPDKLFDYSILTYTLQATKSPKTCLLYTSPSPRDQA